MNLPCIFQVDVPIHIIGGDTALITFTGVGYDKRSLGTTMPMTDGTELTGVPSVQSIPLREQLLYASEERVAFGNLPLFSEQRKVVYLTNRSPSHTVSFEWYVTSEDDSQVRLVPSCVVVTCLLSCITLALAQLRPFL